eukprot:6456775-Amphidinium_carterae.2
MPHVPESVCEQVWRRLSGSRRLTRNQRLWPKQVNSHVPAQAACAFLITFLISQRTFGGAGLVEL